jgi:xanthine/uracil permease
MSTITTAKTAKPNNIATVFYGLFSIALFVVFIMGLDGTIKFVGLLPIIVVGVVSIVMGARVVDRAMDAAKK